MKTNQDGGSVTASDPAAAGKEMAANQTKAAGPAQRQPVNNQTAGKRGKDMVPEKNLKRGDVRADGSIVGEIKNTQKTTKREQRLTKQKSLNNKKPSNRKPKMDTGAPRMGYSQKFGPGRMNGYDAGAKKVMDVMTYGGASKYMAEGPGQSQEGESDRKGRGVFVSGDRAMQAGSNEVAYRHSAAVDGNLTQSQIKKQGPCGGPGQRPCGTNELSAAERSVVNDGDMNNYLSRQVSNTPRGKGFQARMGATYDQNQARQRTADSSYVVSRSNRPLITFTRDFDNTSQGGRPGGRQKGNVIGRYNAVDPNTGRIKNNSEALDPNTGSMTMTKSKVNKKPKKA